MTAEYDETKKQVLEDCDIEIEEMKAEFRANLGTIEFEETFWLLCKGRNGAPLCN